MKVEKVNGHTAEIYDSIDELPIRRFQKYNKLLLVDSGVGSDLMDMLGHIDRVKVYVKRDPNLAIAELDNMRQAVNLVVKGMSPRYLAFAALVAKVDGEAVDDLSDAGLEGVLERLKDVKAGWFGEMLKSAKKKIDMELSLYFPSIFESAQVKEHYDRLKQLAMYRLSHIIEGKDYGKECMEIEEGMVMRSRPKVFSGKNSAEIAYDKDFERICIAITQNLQMQVDGMTVMQFYNAYEHLVDEGKRQRKRMARIKRHK